jgi:GNAT superfamily N-acetyltransferase
VTAAPAPPAAEPLAAPRPVRVRRAEPADAGAVARLFVQLYRAELPALVAGGDAGTAAFLERHLLAQGAARLHGLHVAEREGAVVALAGLNSARDPRPPVGRPDMLRDLVACLGRSGTARLVVPIVRNALSRVAENDPDGAYVHSVVVDEEARGTGAGALLVGALEAKAAARGCGSTLVQVMDGNPAIGFWLARGYERELRLPTGRVPRLVGLGSTLLRRRLER